MSDSLLLFSIWSRSDTTLEGGSLAWLSSLPSSLSGCVAPPSLSFFFSFGLVIVEGGSMSADVMTLFGVMGV